MLRKNIKLLTWFNFFTDFKLYAPVAIIYFARVCGSFALGMSVFSIIMISSALLEIPTGVFSDTIGRRKTVILGKSFFGHVFISISIIEQHIYVLQVAKVEYTNQQISQ